MGMKIVFGGSGLGKSQWIYRELKNHQANLSKEVCYIVPEQFTLEAEQEFLSETGEKGIWGFEVTSFRHLMQQIVQRYQPNAQYWMNDLGRVLVLDQVIEEGKEDLGALQRLKGKPRLLQEFYRDLMDGKWQSVEIEQAILASEAEGAEFADKLQVLFQLLLRYEKALAREGLVDEVLYGQIVCELLKIYKPFESAVIIVDQFWGFTALEMEILAVLHEQAESITIVLTMEAESQSSLFEPIRQTRQALLNRFPQAKEEVYAESKKEPSFQALNHIWVQGQAENTGAVKNVTVYSAVQMEEEVRFCASKMVEWKKAGVPYQDMQVVVCDYPAYLPLIRSIFRQSGIPVHLDHNRKISDYPAAQAVLNYMRFQEWGGYEDLLASLKSGYFQVPVREIDDLELFVKQRGWRKVQKWQEALLTQSLKSGNDGVFRLLQEGTKRRRKNSVEKHWTTLFATLKRTGYFHKFQLRDAQLESEAIRTEHQSIWRGFEAVIDQMLALHGDQAIDAKTFRDQFALGCQLVRIGVLPAVSGEANVRDFLRSRSIKKGYTIVLGMNEGKFPAVDQASGYFDFEEREWLANHEVSMGNTRNFQLQMQELALYQVLAKTSQELIFLWSRKDRNFDALTPSGWLVDLVREGVLKEARVSWKDLMHAPGEATRFCRKVLRKMADDVAVSQEEQKMAKSVYSDLAAEEQKKMMALINYGNQVESLEEALVGALYERNETSITELERHNQCPFAHFIAYGIGPKELNPYRIEDPDVGQVLHDLMELGVGAYLENQLDLDSLEEGVKEFADPYLEAYRDGLFQTSRTNQYIERQIRGSIIASLGQLMVQKSSSRFETVGQEIRFDREAGSLKPLQVQLESGKNVSVCGRIDRMDQYEANGMTYLQVIDYKSGRHPIDWKEMIEGIHLQLPTYLNVCMQNGRNETQVAAGLFHYYLDKPLPTLTSGSGLDEQIRDFYRMRGYALADKAVIVGMDEEILQTGVSKALSARLKKDGSLGKSAQLIHEEKMQMLMSKNIEAIEDVVQDIYKGKIRIQPYEKHGVHACDTCSYGAICQFDPSFSENETRDLEQMEGRDDEMD